MNDKDEAIEYLPNEFLHENALLNPYDRPTLDNEHIHPITSTSKKTLISSSGERKPSKRIFSPPPETFDEASNLGSKRNSRESSTRGSDQGINYNIDTSGSTYALQIALKNMKERYQKLQKKITVLEEENGRLINGKSDLFSEIGKMQESSIKLREKNLQLNHEVHSKHQECCSLQEQFSAISNENLKLCTQLSQSTNEKKKLAKEVEEVTKENTLLEEGLHEILTQCQRYSTIQPEILSQIERIANRSLKKNPYDYVFKTKIIPEAEDFEKMDDFEKMNLPGDCEDLTLDSFTWDESKDVESLSLHVCMKAKESMKKFASLLHNQNQQLAQLKPFMLKVSKRKFDSSDLDEDSGDQCRNYLSRFASCGSGRQTSGLNISSDEHTDTAINDSGGETNVLVEEMEERGRKIPFDWRKVEVSDDEPTTTTGVPLHPKTRTVSTSPDLTLTLDVRRDDLEEEEEERTCPMCHAVFPLVLAQEMFESHVVSHFEAENGFEVIT